jgi:DNA invertase Pin-like site-specific DNA recombinase
MMRAVIYARFSSELQRDESIEDQVEVCRRLIERQGWTVAKVYSDRAQSGASRFRPQYQQMIADAEQKQFDALVCEALDRLGRKLADIADLHDCMSFAGIKIHSVATGEVTQLHIGMLGTMAQLYLSDLCEKVWRGQLGRARQGRIPGGVAYGYDVVSERDASGGGRRLINEAEAAILRRIFKEYAAGASPRTIAKRLNDEGIPGPGGRQWGDTTIRGQVDRGTGLLNNTLYVGRLEWNRTAYVKNPRTGKKVARVNVHAAPSRWTSTTPSMSCMAISNSRCSTRITMSAVSCRSMSMTAQPRARWRSCCGRARHPRGAKSAAICVAWCAASAAIGQPRG